MAKKFIIAGNWKMNPLSLKEAKGLFRKYHKLAEIYPSITLQVYVPAVYLFSIASLGKKSSVQVGAQNIYIEDAGAFTGAISVPMVQDVGGQTALVGHSERRNLFGVSDELIQQKVIHAIAHDLPITVCFGEQFRDEAGTYTEELEVQLQAILKPFAKGRKTKLLTLAYEPVWAIGSAAKRSVDHDELFSTLLLIRNLLTKELGEHRARQIPILYGGSVNAENAGMLSRVPGVAGFLVGRASLDKTSLESICKAI